MLRQHLGQRQPPGPAYTADSRGGRQPFGKLLDIYVEQGRGTAPWMFCMVLGGFPLPVDQRPECVRKWYSLSPHARYVDYYRCARRHRAEPGDQAGDCSQARRGDVRELQYRDDSRTPNSAAASRSQPRGARVAETLGSGDRA